MNTVIRIYCGRNLNNEFRQSPLTESEFDFFLQDVVVPLYDGFTIIPSQGFWKGKREEVFIIEIVTNCGWETEQNINTISAAYVSRYNQDAVMITQQEVEASLYSR